MKTILIKILDTLANKFKHLSSTLKYETYVKQDKFLDPRIIGFEISRRDRCLTLLLENTGLLQYQDVLEAIWDTLWANEEFRNFGVNKMIYITGLYEREAFALHCNVLVNNNTTFEEYFNEIKDSVQGISEFGTLVSNFQVDALQGFSVQVWNMDLYTNKHIKMTRNTVTFGPKIQIRQYSNTIKPIEAKNLNPTIEPFATLDIETIKASPRIQGSLEFKGSRNSKPTLEFKKDNEQLPIAITTTYSLDPLLNKFNTKIFLVEPKLFIKYPQSAVNKLWKKYFDFILKNPILFKHIFVHNLGSFDGLFIFKALANYFSNDPSQVATIIDQKNKFIKIILNSLGSMDSRDSVGSKRNWMDSYRLFPISLEELCKMFNVEGKISSYNKEFNSIDIFTNPKLLEEFKAYAIQDSVALYNALLKAQNIYFNDYMIDITSTLSASALSFKIFRQHFLKDNIPILKHRQDMFIRKGYFGGATDYYRKYGENLHYYDVNSLYPYAMKNPMPFEILKFEDNLENVKLEDFFGFCLAKITTPSNSSYIEYPLLPLKHKDKTIFPLGSWTGVYFSEELKEVVKQGYLVTLISGYKFSKKDLFSEYVDHFYSIKRNAPKNSPQRYISKLHLNTAYGIFGRRKDLLQTINILTRDIPKYAAIRVIKSILKVNDKISTILVHNNFDFKIMKKLNNYFNTEFINTQSDIKCNVAIAAAVTAYARIEMIKLKVLCIKLGIKIYYSDTDSIFTDKPLPWYLVGENLGQLKDELAGLKIKEALFLGIKNYGYTLESPRIKGFEGAKNSKINEYSVWAGVKRDSLSWKEINEISNGKIITKIINDRFYKFMNLLSIQIKDIKIKIKLNKNKTLVNNNYIPIQILNSEELKDSKYNIFDITPLFITLKNKIIKILKKFCIFSNPPLYPRDPRDIQENK